MSPSKKMSSGAIPRPAPLKVHRDSHLIHKAGSSSSSASSSSPSDSDVSNGNSNAQPQQQQQQQQRQPVIIYTHSPKIIHTQARDFMALVQKLTGLSRSEDNEGGPAPPQPEPHPAGRSRSDSKAALRAAAPETSFTRNDHNSSFSPDNSGMTGDVHGGQQLLPPAVSPAVFDPPPPSPFLTDIPLFTPNPSDLFCSPRHYYNYPTTVFSPPNVGSSISPPSVMDVMKAFHEY